MEVYRRWRQTQALAGTTFPEGLKPLLVYNFYGCVSKNHEIYQACGGVCSSGEGTVVSICDGLGGGAVGDETTNQGLEWFNEKET